MRGEHQKRHVVRDVFVVVVLPVFLPLLAEVGEDVLVVRRALLVDEVHEELLQETRYASQVHGEGEITLATKEHTKTSPAKSPTNQEAWQLLAQDLIQAIYETAKKELPLQINFQVVEKEKTDRGSVTLHFSDRNVLLELNGETSQLNWEYAFQLMKLIFTPDYDYDIAKEKPGTKKGIYLDCGDGLWHELGKGVLNIDPEFDAVAQIEEHMRKLTSN